MILAFVIPYRDFVALPRQRWFYAKRVGFLLPLAAVLLVGLVSAASTGFSAGGLEVFGTFTGWLHAMVFFYAALAAASDVMREKESRTLGLLALTDLSPGLQLAGRLLSGLGFMLVALGSAFPLLVLSAALGGVSTGQVAAALAVLGVKALLGTALGLAAALPAADERRMLLRLGLGAAGLWSLTWLAAMAGADLGRAFRDPPMAVIAAGVAGTLLPCVGWTLATHVPASALLVGWAWFGLLRTTAFDNADQPSAPTRPFLSFRCRRGRLPPVSANPVLWKDMNFIYGGLRGEWRGCAILALVVVGTTLVPAAVSRASAMESAAAAGLALGLSLAVALAGLTVYRAARSFQAERRQGALALLLLTDLDEWRIIRGKLGALALAGSPWASAAVFGLFTAWLGFGGAFEALVIGVGMVLVMAAELILFACLAMRLSLACKLPLTLAICGVAFLAWNTCMRNMLILPFMVIAAFMGDTGGGAFSFGVIAIPGVGLDLLAAFLILQQLHRRLRAMAQGGSAC